MKNIYIIIAPTLFFAGNVANYSLFETKQFTNNYLLCIIYGWRKKYDEKDKNYRYYRA